MNTKELQQKQAEYDKDYWQHNASELEKIRHIILHMGNLLGKLTNYCERQEHGENFSSDRIKQEVIPDLIVFSAQLGNVLDIDDIGEAYLNRLKQNIQRFNTNK